ncbi:hypothetical protein R6Z07F_020304 [Ovis aries]
MIYSAPIKLNQSPAKPNENNSSHQHSGFPSKYSGMMRNETVVLEGKVWKNSDIAYAIPKRYIKWDIGNMDF